MSPIDVLVCVAFSDSGGFGGLLSSLLGFVLFVLACLGLVLFVIFWLIPVVYKDWRSRRKR